jgi:hypothetical protein
MNMDGHAKGGKDVIRGGENALNVILGDAMLMSDRTDGGDDRIAAGNYVAAASDGYIPISLVSGDALYFGPSTRADDGPRDEDKLDDAYGHVHGGNDVIVGGSIDGTGSSNLLEMIALNLLTGDALVGISGDGHGGNDKVTGGSATDALVVNLIAGDAGLGMWDHSHGGNDQLVGGDAQGVSLGAFALNVMLGDSMSLLARADAGNDVMKGGDAIRGEGALLSVAVNLMSGDTLLTLGTPKFGNDEMRGGNGGDGDAQAWAVNLMVGDLLGSVEGLFTMLEPLANDYLGESLDGYLDLLKQGLLGDAYDPNPGDHEGKLAKGGGNDRMTGGDGNALNLLVGDAMYMVDAAVGGHDHLEAGNTGLGDALQELVDGFLPPEVGIPQNLMVGDAFYLGGSAVGGKDKLTSGTGNDLMFGDALFVSDSALGGADTFVFRPQNRQDVIGDFHSAEGDRIDLKAFKFVDFAALSARITYSDDGLFGEYATIDTSSGPEDHSYIQVIGVTQFLDTDFVI